MFILHNYFQSWTMWITAHLSVVWFESSDVITQFISSQVVARCWHRNMNDHDLVIGIYHFEFSLDLDFELIRCIFTNREKYFTNFTSI